MSAWLPILAVVGGLLAAFYGLRSLATLAWPPVVVRPAPDPVRRAASLARIEDFRNRRSIEPTDTP